MVIQALNDIHKIHMDLLLLADPSRKLLDQYLSKSNVFVLEDQEELVGCYVLTKVDAQVVEIKNIAVQEHRQGQGFGTMLLTHAVSHARNQGFQKIIIGTGNSSLGQLYFYQKVGFRITGIMKDFFLKNYDQPLVENGLECRDMIVLTKEL